MRTLAIFTVAALMLAGAAQAQRGTPEQRAEARALYTACHADIAKLCPNVQPGGGRIGACLKAHALDLSSDCKLALFNAKAAKDKASGGATPN
jgi:hypothetical protein